MSVSQKTSMIPSCFFYLLFSPIRGVCDLFPFFSSFPTARVKKSDSHWLEPFLPRIWLCNKGKVRVRGGVESDNESQIQVPVPVATAG